MKFYFVIFWGLQTFSSFLTSAPHFLHLYFAFSLSSKSFFLQASLPIPNFVVPDELQQHLQGNCFANIPQSFRQNKPNDADHRCIQSLSTNW